MKKISITNRKRVRGSIAVINIDGGIAHFQGETLTIPAKDATSMLKQFVEQVSKDEQVPIEAAANDQKFLTSVLWKYFEAAVQYDNRDEYIRGIAAVALSVLGDGYYIFNCVDGCANKVSASEYYGIVEYWKQKDQHASNQKLGVAA